MSATLTHRMADALFLIGHDEFSGKPHASLDRLESALAGAALAELIVAGRATIENGNVCCLDPRPWNEPLTDLIISELQGRGDMHPTRVWVRYLREAQQIRERIGARLVALGVVRREQGGVVRKAPRWPAVDPNAAARPRVVLGAQLRSQTEPLNYDAATLASLADIGGLRKIVALGRAAEERIDECRKHLPPPLNTLVAGVVTAVDAATITVRR